MLPGLVPLCRELGPELDGPDGASDLDKQAFLLGLTGQESSWGDRWAAGNFEVAYGRGGQYWNRSAEQKRLVAKWEAFAACSWGPTQILPVVAYEVGWRGEAAWDLADPRTCLTWTVRRFNEKCLRVTVAFGGGFRQEKRPGVTWARMYGFWNGGSGGMQEPPIESVANYIRAQLLNMAAARKILMENGGPAGPMASG